MGLYLNEFSRSVPAGAQGSEEKLGRSSPLAAARRLYQQIQAQSRAQTGVDINFTDQLADRGAP